MPNYQIYRLFLPAYKLIKYRQYCLILETIRYISPLCLEWQGTDFFFKVSNYLELSQTITKTLYIRDKNDTFPYLLSTGVSSAHFITCNPASSSGSGNSMGQEHILAIRSIEVIGRKLRKFTQLKRNKRFDNFIKLVWVQGSPFHIDAVSHPVQKAWGSQDSLYRDQI